MWAVKCAKLKTVWPLVRPRVFSAALGKCSGWWSGGQVHCQPSLYQSSHSPQPWWNPVSDLCVLEPDHNPLRSRVVVRQSSSVPVFTLLVQSQPTALVGSGLGSRPVPVVRNLTIPLRGRVLADCLQMLSEAKGLHSSCLFTEMHLLISALQLPE